ncbi:hypothetical protein NPIL_881 [Nephila pilipes]|uniref:Uncharacterized protein n=1 Tax=Nephila pilipes TaxID=299642 RepID=A0A8X6JHA0_NEPPI|nr:hypothetical protein NPIL_881 [Nephila pilipes]
MNHEFSNCGRRPHVPCGVPTHAAIGDLINILGCLRFLEVEEASTVSLLFVQARSRMAPIKSISIPRRALIACNTGARLANEVSKDLRLTGMDRLIPLELTTEPDVPDQRIDVCQSADGSSFDVNHGTEKFLQSRYGQFLNDVKFEFRTLETQRWDDVAT